MKGIFFFLFLVGIPQVLVNRGVFGVWAGSLFGRGKISCFP